MTALRKYQRLEATGLWRPSPDSQRREVVVSIGEATLTMIDLRNQPLAHWSLAAIERQNPGRMPAIFAPDGDPGETLELSRDADEMIAAIEKLRAAVERARPRPGRLRTLGVIAFVAAVAAVLTVWLPGALISQAVSVVPEIKRQEIGAALLTRIERMAGRACWTPETAPPLRQLANRTGARELAVLDTGHVRARNLVGGIVLLNRALIEDYEDPAIAAGFILAEQLRAARNDPLRTMLEASGMVATFRLLTTGELDRDTLDDHAARVLTQTESPPPEADLLAAFAAARIPSTPYAYAMDATGESMLGLIEADPMAGSGVAPVLADRDWVLLQGICGG